MRIIDLYDDSMFDISEIVRVAPKQQTSAQFELKVSHRGLSESITLSAKDFNSLEDKLEETLLNFDNQWKQLRAKSDS